MSNIYTSADQLIGKTPLLELTHIEKELNLKARILAFSCSSFSMCVSSSRGVLPISWSAEV